MRKLAIGIVVVVAIGVMFVPMAFAQTSQATGPVVEDKWSLGVPGVIHTSMTGQEAIVTETGKVRKVENMAGVKDGLQMRFTNDQGNKYVVYMGPNWFINNQKLKFSPGDKVTVRGKKIGSSIIATQISKGDWTMKLRDEEDGQPSWECCFPGQANE